jgi:hypothetical protein
MTQVEQIVNNIDNGIAYTYKANELCSKNRFYTISKINNSLNKVFCYELKANNLKKKELLKKDMVINIINNCLSY